MNGMREEWTDECRVDGKGEDWDDRGMDRQTGDGWMDDRMMEGWTDRRMDGQKGEWRMAGLMEGWTDEQMMDGRKDESWRGWMMDRQTDAGSFLQSRLFRCHENRRCCGDGTKRSGAERLAFSSAVPPLPKSHNPAASPQLSSAAGLRCVLTLCHAPTFW